MNTQCHCSDNVHPLGESATHPIKPPSGTLAALLVLAGTSLPRPHVLPAQPMTTCSGASNWIQDEFTQLFEEEIARHSEQFRKLQDVRILNESNKYSQCERPMGKYLKPVSC